MRKLLKINKGKRLGGTSGGAASVMKHKWFSGFNWKGLLKKELEVPINPEVSKLGGRGVGCPRTRVKIAGA